MGSEHYCLRWNNHQSNLLGVFSQLLRDESLVDVTLACSEGHSIRAHKVVLSACSSYFQTLFLDHPSRHPIVILKDVRFAELRTLIEFMYKGEVNVEYCQLSALLKTAESLKVKGLAEMTRDYNQEQPPSAPQQQQSTPPSDLSVGHRGVAPMSPSPSLDEQECVRSSQSPLPLASGRACRSPGERTPETKRSASPEDTLPGGIVLKSECGASDLSLPPANNTLSTPCQATPTHCSRLPSPQTTDPLPGPSNLPPVQQVPLSLKKEVDWSGGDKSTGESCSDFSRHPHDTAQEVETSPQSPLEGPSSTQSSRSSTPFALPFSTLPSSILEVGLLHPSLLGDEIFRCPSCMAAFPSLWLLEQHTALQHIGAVPSIDKPFVCEQCGQSYRYRSAYVKHREQNHRARLPADKLFSCDVCGMQFRYLKSFKKHRLNHALEKLHGKTERKDEETKGGDHSSDQVSSSNEALAVKEVKEEPQNDDLGGEGESTPSDSDKPEMEQDDTIDSMAFPLPITAGGNTTTPDLLHANRTTSILNLLHTETIDRQRERRFACPFCGKCVRSKENLKLHVRKHTGERPFVCLFCGRAFGGKSDLTRHLRIHTGERPYHCDMCGKCFARADYLSKHLTTHINTPR